MLVRVCSWATYPQPQMRFVVLCCLDEISIHVMQTRIYSSAVKRKVQESRRDLDPTVTLPLEPRRRCPI